MKFAVKYPLRSRISGARTNWTILGKKPWRSERASAGLDCKSEFTTRRPPESLLSAEEKYFPDARRGRSCTCGDGLSETILCRWPSSCSGRTPHTSCTETSRLRETFCYDRAVRCRPCSSGVQSPAAWAPNLQHLFEYSLKDQYSQAIGRITRRIPILRLQMTITKSESLPIPYTSL